MACVSKTYALRRVKCARIKRDLLKSPRAEHSGVQASPAMPISTLPVTETADLAGGLGAPSAPQDASVSKAATTAKLRNILLVILLADRHSESPNRRRQSRSNTDATRRHDDPCMRARIRTGRKASSRERKQMHAGSKHLREPCLPRRDLCSDLIRRGAAKALTACNRVVHAKHRVNLLCD